MNVRTTLFSLFLSILFIFPAVSLSQTNTAEVSELQAEMISSWLVTVRGEDRTRTLRVVGVKQGEPGTLILDAFYGWTDGNQTPLPRAEINQTAQKRALLITTQPGSKIATIQNPDGVFVGTFTSTNGQVKGIEIKKLSNDALAVLAADPTVIPAAANVPASCAVFLGGRVGNWGFGQRLIWITEVDAQCVAKYSYSPQTRTFKSAEIKDGTLSFPCGTSGGTCTFTAHGDELWGRYGGPDGFNNAVFRKVAGQQSASR